MTRKRFVALDRDGTLIVERHYLSDPRGVELVPGAVEGLRHMRRLGLGLVVLTNQSAVGRGFFDVRQLARIHRRMTELLAAEGVRLDGIYFCPHKPDDDCRCRKPRTGLIRDAGRELDFDPAYAFVVGDKPCDIHLGRTVGATTFLVRTGYGAQYADHPNVHPDGIADDLPGVAHMIESILLATRAAPHERARRTVASGTPVLQTGR